MHDPARILIVDDSPTNRDVLATRLATHGYDLSQAADGEEALAAVKTLIPDLVLLDVMMPKMNGFDACRLLKNDPTLPFIPVILVTAKADTQDVITGLEAGADEYLTKPVDQAALVARVRSMLRLKALHDRTVAHAADLAKWNQTLERRVSEQIAEIDRIGRVKRFLPPQIARLVTTPGHENLLESHRRNVAVVFCDLRGFSAFSELAEPEEMLQVMREYHVILGKLADKYEGTVERFTGDGLLVVFNDPVPCPDPCLRAVQMAVEMRDQVAKLSQKWSRSGHHLGFGIGIAYGYATLGTIGYEGRLQYSVTGKVANLAARLCGEAKDGDVLIDISVRSAAEAHGDIEFIGELNFPGFTRPVKTFNVLKLKPISSASPGPSASASSHIHILGERMPTEQPAQN
jgi:class 3 adenylate cyclase/CheY-like chemotaxis protein